MCAACSTPHPGRAVQLRLRLDPRLLPELARSPVAINATLAAATAGLADTTSAATTAPPPRRPDPRQTHVPRLGRALHLGMVGLTYPTVAACHGDATTSGEATGHQASPNRAPRSIRRRARPSRAAQPGSMRLAPASSSRSSWRSVPTSWTCLGSGTELSDALAVSVHVRLPRRSQRRRLALGSPC